LMQEFFGLNKTEFCLTDRRYFHILKLNICYSFGIPFVLRLSGFLQGGYDMLLSFNIAAKFCYLQFKLLNTFRLLFVAG
uniref:Glycosyl transferase family 2 n=1 Tax=Rodentolepis nana TaxID=102285 RepID=A0A0R3THN9_RODNA